MKVIGYLRVSTEEQAESGLGLDAQRAAITARATAEGWQVTWLIDAGLSGKSLDRPALQEALAMLKRREADALVVAKLDRLSRSLKDFAGLLEIGAKRGWALVALDLGIDTSTIAGELLANVMASVARWERRTIGARTSAALRAAQARGVHVGRTVQIAPEVIEDVLDMWERGYSKAKIARTLTERGVPTIKGGPWAGSTITKIIARHADHICGPDHECVITPPHLKALSDAGLPPYAPEVNCVIEED